MIKTGDKVTIVCRGAMHPVPGTVLLASENGKSLALSFDAILDGHLGMMPVLLGDDGLYRSVVTGTEVVITGS